MTTAFPVGVPTLLDTQLTSRTRTVLAVVGFALATAALAQVSIPLGFTPVPITGQTLAVLLSGAVLGSKRGAASQALYVALGAIGLPFYSEASGGWDVATGATAGYLVGFVVAAFAIGRLAERGQDRHVETAIPAFLLGSAIIYAFGATWLSRNLDVPFADGDPSALSLGVTPFLVGDALKVIIASVALPILHRRLPR
jgi:biotin transport system substrate-specific component